MTGDQKRSKSLNLALRILGAGASFWVAYYFFTHRLTGAAPLVIGIVGVIGFRALVRANSIPGLKGIPESAFKLRPVFRDLAKAAGLVLAGFVWVGLGALAVRYRYLPDSIAGATMGIFPGLGLIVWGFGYLLRAQVRAMRGGPP